MKEVVKSVYGNRVRARACGICIHRGEILLVKHTGLGPEGVLWAPPGGGIEFGESAEDSLKREFKEETGLDVTVKEFLFVNEFISRELHAIELFYAVERTGGELVKGLDPELAEDQQIIKDTRFVTFDEIGVIPSEKKHNIFNIAKEASELLNLRGYFKFCQ